MKEGVRAGRLYTVIVAGREDFMIPPCCFPFEKPNDLTCEENENEEDRNVFLCVFFLLLLLLVMFLRQGVEVRWRACEV